MEDLKTMFGDREELKAALKESLGVAIPGSKIPRKHKEFDIGIRVRGRRAYLHCLKTGGNDQTRILVKSIGGWHG